MPHTGGELSDAHRFRWPSSGQVEVPLGYSVTSSLGKSQVNDFQLTPPFGRFEPAVPASELPARLERRAPPTTARSRQRTGETRCPTWDEVRALPARTGVWEGQGARRPRKPWTGRWLAAQHTARTSTPGVGSRGRSRALLAIAVSELAHLLADLADRLLLQLANALAAEIVVGAPPSVVSRFSARRASSAARAGPSSAFARPPSRCAQSEAKVAPRARRSMRCAGLECPRPHWGSENPRTRSVLSAD